MSKRYIGVRHIEGDTYEVNFRPYRKADRVYKRIKANSMQEAYNKRAEILSQYAKKHNIPETEKERQNADLKFLKEVLENDLKSDNKNRKTINRFLLSFKIFVDFLNRKHPYIDNINPVFSAIVSSSLRAN